jgi:transcriptional regulator with GAF, ATPase, and Fis domain
MNDPSTIEARRLETLRAFEILDTPAEQTFDDLARLAGQICDTPIALISFIDADRQWFKARLGLDATESPRDTSFCAHAISSRDVFVVSDTLNDERFSDNVFVSGPPHVRFYAGVPLVTASGDALGTVCVLDRMPRTVTPAQLDGLRVLSRQIVASLELRRARSGASEEERKRAEELLRAITEGTAAVTGGAFFSSLVEHVAMALRVRRVYVAECLPDDRARSRALWMGDAPAPNFEYDLKGTPCMKVNATGETCLYSRNLREYFPENPFIARFGYESYLGIPLWSSAGERRVIGHMVLVNDKPMSEDPLWVSVLQTFASRAGVELEREQAEEKLHLALGEVETLKNRLQAENVYLQEEIRKEHNFEEMVGNSPALLALTQKLERVAGTDATVLICGETGTGKELIARALHSSGHRKQRPLVKVNCGAVPASLLESELFGHVKGAFTGAIDRRVGRFELADGGTLFLDEIGELPLDTQVKLLRVLQEQEFEPVGSSRTIRVDVRVIAATNRDLEQEVRAGRFRSDLFFRLNVVPLNVPPLRERTSDIPMLVAYFLSRFSKKFGRKIDGVTRDTMDRLVKYQWPGNIRELQNIVERAVVMATGPLVSLEADVLPTSVTTAAKPTVAVRTGDVAAVSMDEAERRHIEAVLSQTGGVIEGPSGAAVILNLHPNTLRSRMKKLGVTRSSASRL